jgi:electron transport complex protein RnfA
MEASIAVIVVSAILTENIVLTQFLGICPFLGVSKKLSTAFGMSCAAFLKRLTALMARPYVHLVLTGPLCQPLQG